MGDQSEDVEGKSDGTSDRGDVSLVQSKRSMDSPGMVTVAKGRDREAQQKRFEYYLHLGGLERWKETHPKQKDIFMKDSVPGPKGLKEKYPIGEDVRQWRSMVRQTRQNAGDRDQKEKEEAKQWLTQIRTALVDRKLCLEKDLPNPYWMPRDGESQWFEFYLEEGLKKWRQANPDAKDLGAVDVVYDAEHTVSYPIGKDISRWKDAARLYPTVESKVKLWEEKKRRLTLIRMTLMDLGLRDSTLPNPYWLPRVSHEAEKEHAQMFAFLKEKGLKLWKEQCPGKKDIEWFDEVIDENNTAYKIGQYLLMWKRMVLWPIAPGVKEDEEVKGTLRWSQTRRRFWLISIREELIKQCGIQHDDLPNPYWSSESLLENPIEKERFEWYMSKGLELWREKYPGKRDVELLDTLTAGETNTYEIGKDIWKWKVIARMDPPNDHVEMADWDLKRLWLTRIRLILAEKLNSKGLPDPYWFDPDELTNTFIEALKEWKKRGKFAPFPPQGEEVKDIGNVLVVKIGVWLANLISKGRTDPDGGEARLLDGRVREALDMDHKGWWKQGRMERRVEDLTHALQLWQVEHGIGVIPKPTDSVTDPETGEVYEVGRWLNKNKLAARKNPQKDSNSKRSVEIAAKILELKPKWYEDDQKQILNKAEDNSAAETLLGMAQDPWQLGLTNSGRSRLLKGERRVRVSPRFKRLFDPMFSEFRLPSVESSAKAEDIVRIWAIVNNKSVEIKEQDFNYERETYMSDHELTQRLKRIENDGRAMVQFLKERFGSRDIKRKLSDVTDEDIITETNYDNIKKTRYAANLHLADMDSTRDKTNKVETVQTLVELERLSWPEKYALHQSEMQKLGQWPSQPNRLYSNLQIEKSIVSRFNELLNTKRTFDADCKEFHHFYLGTGFDFKEQWEKKREEQKRSKEREHEWKTLSWPTKYTMHQSKMQELGLWPTGRLNKAEVPQIFRLKSEIEIEKLVAQRHAFLLGRDIFDDACEEFHKFYYDVIGYNFRANFDLHKLRTVKEKAIPTREEFLRALGLRLQRFRKDPGFRLVPPYRNIMEMDLGDGNGVRKFRLGSFVSDEKQKFKKGLRTNAQMTELGRALGFTVGEAQDLTWWEKNPGQYPRPSPWLTKLDEVNSAGGVGSKTSKSKILQQWLDDQIALYVEGNLDEEKTEGIVYISAIEKKKALEQIRNWGEMVDAYKRNQLQYKSNHCPPKDHQGFFSKINPFKRRYSGTKFDSVSNPEGRMENSLHEENDTGALRTDKPVEEKLTIGESLQEKFRNTAETEASIFKLVNILGDFLLSQQEMDLYERLFQHFTSIELSALELDRLRMVYKLVKTMLQSGSSPDRCVKNISAFLHPSPVGQNTL